MIPELLTLPPKQLQVTCQVLEGMTPQEIAAKTGMSASSVSTHIKRVCLKFDMPKNKTGYGDLFHLVRGMEQEQINEIVRRTEKLVKKGNWCTASWMDERDSVLKLIETYRKPMSGIVGGRG